MTLLLLVRHGETGWNAERRLQGSEDVELSVRGRAQVRAMVPLVAAHRPTGVTSSPLARARQSAALLGAELPALAGGRPGGVDRTHPGGARGRR